MDEATNVSGSMLAGILPAPYMPRVHDFEEWAATLHCGLHAANLRKNSIIAIIRARVPKEGQDTICDLKMEDGEEDPLTKIIDVLRQALVKKDKRT